MLVIFIKPFIHFFHWKRSIFTVFPFSIFPSHLCQNPRQPTISRPTFWFILALFPSALWDPRVGKIISLQFLSVNEIMLPEYRPLLFHLTWKKRKNRKTEKQEKRNRNAQGDNKEVFFWTFRFPFYRRIPKYQKPIQKILWKKIKNHKMGDIFSQSCDHNQALHSSVVEKPGNRHWGVCFI